MKYQVYRTKILPRDKISQLLGEDLSNIVYYNYQSKKWGDTKYHGYDVLYQNCLHGMFDTMRKIQEQEPQMQGRRIVLNAIKATNPSNFDSLYSFKRDVPFQMNTGLACNQIVYNEKNGLFESIPAGWFYVMDAPSVSAAAGLGMEYFAEAIIMMPEVRNRFLHGYQNTR